MSYLQLLSGKYETLDNQELSFIESSEHEAGFAEHYKLNLKPIAQKYEEKRLKALTTASSRLKLSIPLGFIAAGIAGAVFMVSDIQFALVVFVILIMGLAAWVYSSIRGYQSEVKGDVFPRILSFYQNVHYSPYCPSKMHEFSDSQIVPDYDREESEDEIRTSYKGVELNVFETDLQERRTQDDKDKYVTIFDGVVVHLSFNKRFNGITVVKRDRGSLLNWVNSKFSSLETVRLEDPKFESKFEIYSNDQIEARYLLTTSFMERLLELEEFFNGNGLQASFFNDKLLLMIPMKTNLFEPGSVFQPEDFIDDSRKLITEMNLLFKIVDTLKLDMDIGL